MEKTIKIFYLLLTLGALLGEVVIIYDFIEYKNSSILSIYSSLVLLYIIYISLNAFFSPKNKGENINKGWASLIILISLDFILIFDNTSLLHKYFNFINIITVLALVLFNVSMFGLFVCEKLKK